MYKKHLFTLSLTLIIVMLFSALGPTTVYADDGAPTDAPTTEGSETDGETTEDEATDEQTNETGEGEAGEATTEEVVTEDELADETNEGEVDEAATEEVVAEGELDGATSEGETEEVTTEEPSLMEQVPDNTEIVVVNAEGEVEPLATQEAAEAVATSDPIWCPAGQAPTPGANGCTDSYSSFDELLTFLQTNEGDAAYQQAGTIYVEMGVYGGGESSIDFNNYGFTNFDDNDLTIQGGWNTSTGTTTDTTSFDVPIVIGSDVNPWGGSLTIRNIIVSGVVNDTGLTVYSDGSVTVEDSEFTNNDAAGVFIDADDNVTVRRTKINDNGSNAQEVADGKGLEIKSGGYVTLSDVEANDNQIFGANIEAVAGAAIANSFFNGNLMYTAMYPDGVEVPLEFLGYGLAVVSQGDISVATVEANENFLWGAWFDGSNVFIENSTFNRNFSDSDLFIDDTGLVIITTGDATLDSVQANENRLIGADIQANGQVDIRNSSFNNNFGTILDANGAETYWGCGLQVAGAPTGGVQVGTIQDCDPQNTSASSINLSNVTANGNYIYGANLFSSGTVNISGSSFSNNVSPADEGYGLIIQSGDFVSLNTVTANDNGLFGADIVADGFIDIQDSVFSNNMNGSGLSAISNTTEGTFITLTNVIAEGNAGDGAYLETNCGRANVDGGVFAGNDQYGLQVVNSLLTQSATFGPPDNGAGSTFVIPPTGCNNFPSPPSKSGEAVLYTITTQTQEELPVRLGQGNTFVSAFQLTFTGQVTNLAITLSFPIPAGMEGADLAVMFWDGSGWVEVPGGSVVGDQFVIAVSQPGVYVLVSK